MQSVTLVIAVLGLAVCSQSASLTSYLNAADQTRLKSVFDATLTDAATAYHSIRGLSLLGSTPSGMCAQVKAFYTPTSTLESLFYASSAASYLKDCKLTPGTAQKLCEDAIQSSTKVVDIYHAYFSLRNLKLKVDNDATVKAVNAALKKDDSLVSHAYAFLIASELPKSAAQPFFDLVEDMVAQADTVDSTYMQFEGGLFSTALMVESMYRLAETVNKAPLDGNQAIMFVNYLMSRKHIHRLKSASQLLATIRKVSSNKLHRPLTFDLATPLLSLSSNLQLGIKVRDLMGQEVSGLTLVANSVKHTASGAVIVNKLPLAASGATHTLDLSKVKATHGFYRVSVTATAKPANSALIGLTNDQLEVKVVTTVTVTDVELGVGDKDQATAPTMTRVQPPKKATSKIDADYHQKLVMTFALKDSAGSPMQVHQAFVMLIHKETKQEIVFVALPNDAGSAYKFELDLGSREKDFGSLSGVYEVNLILGDAVVENPQQWALADVSLTFLGKPGAQKPSAYEPKPIIQHKFREPEKRPPSAVSSFFTMLCAAPLLLALALWMGLGANISNLSNTGLYGIGFHVGLAAIFGLYYFYWVQLNMFQTLQYLTYIGIPTFFCGNRLLRGIAEKRKS